MCPYPAQVTRDRIIETAWGLVETTGDLNQVALNHLAAALGIKAPSLYRHVASKTELLQAINTRTYTLLFQAMDAALPAAVDQVDDPAAVLLTLALAYRQFAHAHPAVYLLAFTTLDPAARPTVDEQLANVLVYQRLIGQISGEEASLPALRGLLALMHGFVALEINDQLRRGGSLDEAYEQALRAYLRGWTG